MGKAIILEIKAEQVELYKKFFSIGLAQDEENFRISPADEIDTSFPTKDKADSFTLGAYADGQLAGVVSFARDGSDREKLQHKGILFRMYVASGYRGYGIGAALINELVNRVNLIGDIEQINLTVMSNNMVAKNLYHKFGFKTFGSEENAIKWKGKYFREDQMVLGLMK